MQKDMALLLIDTQVNMFSPDPVYDGEALLARLETLLARARAASWVVAHIQNNGGPGDPDEPETPGWQLYPALAAAAGELTLAKKTPDAFSGTLLHQELQVRGVRCLVVAGLQTEMCVDTTVRAARSLGYGVTLVADGHSTFATPTLTAVQIIAHHNDILTAFAHVLTLAELNFTAGADVSPLNLHEAFTTPDLAAMRAGLREVAAGSIRYQHPIHALSALRQAWDAKFVPPMYRLAAHQWEVGLAETLLQPLRRLLPPLQKMVGTEVTAVAQNLLKAALQEPDEQLAVLDEAQTLWRYQAEPFRLVYHRDEETRRLTLLALTDLAPLTAVSPLELLQKRWGRKT